MTRSGVGCLWCLAILGYSAAVSVPAVNAQSDLVSPADDAPRYRDLPRCPEPDAHAVCFEFEGAGTDGWSCPAWFGLKDRYRSSTVGVAARPGTTDDGRALHLQTTWPGLHWCATGIRLEGPVDLSSFSMLTARIRLDDNLPGRSVAARLIVVAGDDWHWYEARRKTYLKAGRWIPFQAPLAGESTADQMLDYWGPKAMELVKDQAIVQEIILRIEAVATDRGSNLTDVDRDIHIDSITLIP